MLRHRDHFTLFHRAFLPSIALAARCCKAALGACDAQEGAGWSGMWHPAKDKKPGDINGNTPAVLATGKDSSVSVSVRTNHTVKLSTSSWVRKVSVL